MPKCNLVSFFTPLAALTIFCIVFVGYITFKEQNIRSETRPRRYRNEEVEKIVVNNGDKAGQLNTYSAANIPKFCQGLKKPRKFIPPVSTSARLAELNAFQYKEPLVGQDDPRILMYMWDHCDNYLRPPNGKPSRNSQGGNSMGQDNIIITLFQNMTGGFFVECGALEGTISSNTFKLENEFGWTGLLIEADPTNVKTMLRRHNRNAWISQSCLSPLQYPMNATFRQIGGLRDSGRIVEEASANSTSDLFQVQCFSFFSFMAALNIKTVDYFSLDIEGGELKVLQTIPFDKILIKVLTVEILGIPEGPSVLQKYMDGKGYRMLAKFLHNGIVFDYIFVHKTFVVHPKVLNILQNKV